MDFLTTLLLLGVGGLAGAAFAGIFRRKASAEMARQDVTILLERLEKVFKVVMAEGYFTEIFNYQDDRRFLYLFPDPKKAMIIAKAKVLVGFDFQKVRFQAPDGTGKRLVVEHFPAPEVLSIDTDYQFYDITPGYLNHFQSSDYTKILDDAKRAMQDRAMQSDLPRIASNQIQYMLLQLAGAAGWTLELPAADQQRLDALATRYDGTRADPRPLLDKPEDLPPTT